ncbi:YciI family protein [Streptomyces argenteolus]|uniref:YciI family protein n=1 Tax=Streptomyces argenteolus TaxID=67274 RepID=A0ABW6XAN3_9ACTN
MKYFVMVQGTQADYEAMAGRASADSPAWTEQDVRAMFAFMEGINAELVESGEMVEGQGLAEPARTRSVLPPGADGRPVVSDGPDREGELRLAGYWVLDCASPERVTEIAARIAQCPQPEGAPVHPVLIRPVMDDGGELTGATG